MRSEIRDLGMFGTRNWARRSAGIPNWGHSDLGVQSRRKSQRLVSLDFDFVFSVLVKICWEEHIQNDPFFVDWDVKP